MKAEEDHENSSTLPSQPPPTKEIMNMVTPTMSGVFKAPFILLLGDHTYQQYCLGLNIPVAFYDAATGLTIQTTYAMCFLTKFAFFSFLTHTIHQIDEDLRIFGFKEALPEFDPNIPLSPELRNLNDVSAKLKKVTLPMYPVLIRNHAKLAGDLTGEKSIFELSDYISIIPDISFSLLLKNADRRTFSFKRSFYSPYYTNFSSPNDSQVDTNSIQYHERNKTDPPGFIHMQEKEKEDSFFILQYALPTLMKHLPLDQIVLVLGCAINEMKIIVQHKDLNVISSVILALMHLLRPLKWCSPVIVTLPDQLTDLIGKISYPTSSVFHLTC